MHADYPEWSDWFQIGDIWDYDGVIFFNFRADHAKEITRTLTDPAFEFFTRDPNPKLCNYTCMTLYDEKFNLPIAFPPVHSVAWEILPR